MSAEDLRPLFTERSAAKVHAGLAMQSVADAPRLKLDPDTVGLLRDGLGFYDMEIRWVAHLDEADAFEPAMFERMLGITVNHLRRFRAGHTPYGPSPSAGPAPDLWP